MSNCSNLIGARNVVKNSYAPIHVFDDVKNFNDLSQ
jgi:hypothetical protein